MRAFADDLRHTAAVGRLCQDTAYLRVGGGEADGFSGELEGPPHEDFVLSFFVLVVRHTFRHCLEGIESSMLAAMRQRRESILRLAGACEGLVLGSPYSFDSGVGCRSWGWGCLTDGEGRGC